MIAIGIDPGISGAIAIIGVDKEKRYIKVGSFPILKIPLTTKTKSGKQKEKSELDIVALKNYLDNTLTTLISESNSTLPISPIVAAIEAVSAMPGQGVVSMFNFGDNFGQLKAFLRLYQFQKNPVHLALVRAQSWKKVILKDISKDKNAAIFYVQNKYPEINLLPSARARLPHSGMAEAICLAEYAIHMWSAE